MREEEIKNVIKEKWFSQFDCTKIIGNIDFSVAVKDCKTEKRFFLWAEAKRDNGNLEYAITQLILTVGKARTFDSYLPPVYLGAFNAEKIAFVPYSEVQEIFYINDFNWNVTPSNHNTKEFNLVLQKVKSTLEKHLLVFDYQRENDELKEFINKNFVIGKSNTSKIQIDKNNFIIIYNKWLQTVKPTIAVDWNIAKQKGIIDGDFYLADLIAQENYTLKEKLFVLLKHDHYEFDREIDSAGIFSSKQTQFKDKQVAHTQFWNKYERPPKEEYWDYIIERRDLLVPQDIRERKGSFFTPQIWVGLAQQYLADILGENWQEEYFIWDCASGTGNLLAGLTNKYNIYASTLDKQDVEVIHDRIDNGANLLHEHVFQFDFLNDDFVPKSKGGKLPDTLFNIINDAEKRKRLVMFINPPYAEAPTTKTRIGTGENKAGVAKNNKANTLFKDGIGNASRELFALFMAIIYEKIPNCILAQFSTLKFIQGNNFRKFKEFFKAKFLGGFIVPADTFDNVKGQFSIGFTVWNTNQKEKITIIDCDVYERNGEKTGIKTFKADLPQSVSKWIAKYNDNTSLALGVLRRSAPDFQNSNLVHISNKKGAGCFYWNITKENLFKGSVYFAVRLCVKATWLNNRDQFLYPNSSCEKDIEFQSDCLAFTLFHTQNRITCTEGTNHWIPFTEQEVNAKTRFDSNFMSDFIKGKVTAETQSSLYNYQTTLKPIEFSPEAKAVFEAGKELWKYYHQQQNINVNASLYDIREFFQGRNEKGKMNAKSKDVIYNSLINTLKQKMQILANKIEKKVYLYEFLK
jgi:hypothetical protein